MIDEKEVLFRSSDQLQHTCRVKTYPDGRKSLLVADRAIFRETGWEDSSERTRREKEARESLDAWLELVCPSTDVGDRTTYALYREDDKRRESLARSMRRAKTNIRDLGLSNDWRYFVTLTLDQSRIDRYDVKEITRHLNHWLDNQVRREGLVYVLVPERHKDGAIHFHGLFNGALTAEDSGTVDYMGKPRKPRTARQRASWLENGGHVVYNLPAWGWGFSTAIELYGDREAAVGYVVKYIGKQMQPDGMGGLRPGKIGGRWYYSGGDLLRPAVSWCDLEPGAFEKLPGFCFEIEALGCRCKKIEIDPDGNIIENKDKKEKEKESNGRKEGMD